MQLSAAATCVKCSLCESTLKKKIGFLKRFKSICLRFENRIEWHLLQPVLIDLLTTYHHELVRVKGVIYTQEHEKPMIVQGGNGYLHPPTFLEMREFNDEIGRLVFITDGELVNLAEDLMAKLQKVKQI